MTGEPHPSTHPPLPPTTEDDRFSWLRLLRSRRVGPATFWRMLAEHGSARAALSALPEVARAAGIDDYTICPEGVIAAELRAGRAAGAILLTGACTAYPADLREISDAPPALWCLGDVSFLARPMVALVGARNVSSLGTRMARKLAAGLTDAGVVVVSGLARGVDAEAHSAAIAGGTVAVMAGGVDSIYPVENGSLAQRIAETGLRISEQPMGLTAQARHFVARNRIVSGLARAVVVVEAAAKSGSLITARNALDQGRDVLAVPGHPFDARSAGSNMLLRDGAILVRGPNDVLEHLNLPAVAARTRPVARADADRCQDAAMRQPDTDDSNAAAPRRADPVHGQTDATWPAVGSPVRGTSPDPTPAPCHSAPSASVPSSYAQDTPPSAANRGDKDSGGQVRDHAKAGAGDPCESRAALPGNLWSGAVPPGSRERRGLSETAALHQAILDRVSLSPVAEDQLIRDLAASSQRIGPALVTLELDGRIARRTGGLLATG